MLLPLPLLKLLLRELQMQMLKNVNGTLDDGKVSAILMVLVYLGCSVYAIYKGQLWNPQDFGIGAGALMAGVGGMFKLKS